jgi:hypothetical protein
MAVIPVAVAVEAQQLKMSTPVLAATVATATFGS